MSSSSPFYVFPIVQSIIYWQWHIIFAPTFHVAGRCHLWHRFYIEMVFCARKQHELKSRRLVAHFSLKWVHFRYIYTGIVGTNSVELVALTSAVWSNMLRENSNQLNGFETETKWEAMWNTTILFCARFLAPFLACTK